MTKDILNAKPLKIADNLTKQERVALKNPTERNNMHYKGKATVIMDTNKFKAECFRQLNNPKFFEQLPKDITHQVEDRIRILHLKRLLIDDEIEEDTYNYLVPHHSRPARFYILPKIHKNKDNPPGRPIISASFHPTERISEFVDYQLNPLVPKLPSYIKDTTHFLQKLDSLPELAYGCLLVTLDVSSLYTNIPHKEGIHAFRKALESHTNARLKTESICDLIRMILTMNNFEFENNYYLQLYGTAMGTKMAPAYANLFMGDLEQNLLAQYPLKPLVWWRYIDDIFMIWPHGKEKLNEFVNLLNSSHETIKFTHEVSPSKINFLDVTVLLHNNDITTDLLSCSSDNLVYMINCKRCLKTETPLSSQYIGQTGRTLRERFGEHRRGIQNNIDESVPIHFNLPHHTLDDVELVPLLKLRNSRDSYHYTMEQHFISTAGTLKKCINRTSDH